MEHTQNSPVAIQVHGIDDALAAAAAARVLGLPLTLTSAPGAAAFAGPLWFREIVAAAQAAAPELTISGVLDCADDPGHAMAALRAGVTAIVFTGEAAVADKLAAMAQATGATVHRARPETFDPSDAPDKQAACEQALAG